MFKPIFSLSCFNLEGNFFKAGLHDHFYIKLASHFDVIIECDRENGLQSCLKSCEAIEINPL